MKEAITKFDLESAFKALDEIDIPVAKKVKANKPALTEIFSSKSKFDSLFEEYYDVGNTTELDDAKEAREAEVAKAKLARIEKIVDLEADSPEDLLTSYVGKYIIQCPQCMTLFYKNPEDIVETEDDPETVNVNEVCQHCGNETGYTLVGKVGEVEADEVDNFTAEEPVAEETPVEEVPTEEESIEDSEGLDDIGDLEELDLNIEDDETEETKEESFTAHEGATLVEELTDEADLDAKLEAHNEYIEYLRNTIAQEETALEKATNEQVKAAIQRRVDAFKVDLESALPDAVKNEMAMEEAPIEDTPADETPAEETTVQEESLATEESNALTEALHEDKDLDVSADEFEELINSPEFKKSISDTAARAMINAEKEDETAEETNEALEEGIFDKLKLTRSGKADWILKNARIDYNKDMSADENRKFTTFLVIGYTDTDKIGKKIKEAPKYDSKNLVVGMSYPEAKQTYADAEKVAKGWSMIDGNGPAFIYLAKDKKGDNAAFLCQYFKGALDAKSDQLENYFGKVKSSLAGSKLLAKGGADQSDTKNLKASEVEPGMKTKFKNGVAEITEIKNSDIRDGYKSISVKFEDGSVRDIEFGINDVLAVMRDSVTTESLDTFMAGLEELQESSLETLISDSLVEAYGNVAGFRLTECAYINNKFTVNGTIHFTSGRTRKTTYTFESYEASEGKINLHGLNEKLGLDKQFMLTGRIENKTLITESFKCNK